MSLLLTLVVSCNKPEPEPVVEPLPFAFSDTLLRIDSVMRHDADSALIMLMSFRPTEGSGEISSQFNANYQSLLLSEALYKTDNAQSNRDEVQTAVQYFDSIYAIYHTDELAMFAARSHYMNGVGHYENDSVVNALKEYLRTLEIMENHFEDNDITGYRAKFMGLTYTRMGEVYYDYGVAKAAGELYKGALFCFKKVSNYNLANTYRHIGGAYRLDHINDSAVYYYKKSICYAKQYNNIILYGASLSESAPIYYDLGYIDSAFMIIRKALSLPTVEDSRLAQYYTLGSLYAKTGQYDSAIFYLKQSIERNSFATQTSSADLLISCYNAIGDSTMTAYYTIVYGNCFTKYREYSDIKSELAKIYDANFGSILQNKYTLMAAHQQRRNVLLSTLFFLLLCFTIVFTRKTEKSRKEVARKDQELAIIKRKMSASTFMEEPICKMIMNIVNAQQFKSKIDYYYYRDFALGKEHLMELREAVNLHYDSFTIRLRNKYPELTDYDIDYCCLYLLGLKDADISALMQRSYRAVCDRNKKLRSIFRIDYSINTFLREFVYTGFKD